MPIMKYKDQTIGGSSKIPIDGTLTKAEDGKYGVSTPVQGIVSQEEYDALTDAEKSKGLYVIDDGQNGSKIVLNGEEIDASNERIAVVDSDEPITSVEEFTSLLHGSYEGYVYLRNATFSFTSSNSDDLNFYSVFATWDTVQERYQQYMTLITMSGINTEYTFYYPDETPSVFHSWSKSPAQNAENVSYSSDSYGNNVRNVSQALDSLAPALSITLPLEVIHDTTILDGNALLSHVPYHQSKNFFLKNVWFGTPDAESSYFVEGDIATILNQGNQGYGIYIIELHLLNYVCVTLSSYNNEEPYVIERIETKIPANGVAYDNNHSVKNVLDNLNDEMPKKLTLKRVENQTINRKDNLTSTVQDHFFLAVNTNFEPKQSDDVAYLLDDVIFHHSDYDFIHWEILLDAAGEETNKIRLQILGQDPLLITLDEDGYFDTCQVESSSTMSPIPISELEVMLV